MVTYKIFAKDVGECGVHPEITKVVWDEFYEMQNVAKHDWCVKAQGYVERLNRYEVYAYNDLDEVIGIMVLTHELADFHVGECFTIMCNFVKPEYRSAKIGVRFIQTAKILARLHGITTLAYSHRVGVGDYRVRYRKINGGQ